MTTGQLSPTPPGPHMAKVTLELPDDLIATLERGAKRAGITLGEQVGRVLAYGLAITAPMLNGDEEEK